MVSLVIMAAGNSSRYRYSKQIDELYQDYSLMDFSIYDAFFTGFQKIVLIINHKQQFFFQKKYKTLIQKKKIILKIQDLTFLPPHHNFQGIRKKPWGTAHCVYCVKDILKENFALINCDDFYGRKAFFIMKKHLANTKQKKQFFMISYQLQNTLSPNGPVSRGICRCLADNLLAVEEITKIRKIGSKIVANEDKELKKETLVSMNFWGFTSFIQELIEKEFLHFLAHEDPNLETEFYIPSVLNLALQKKLVQIRLLQVESSWFGLTYPLDKSVASKNIQKLVFQRAYPEKLWS